MIDPADWSRYQNCSDPLDIFSFLRKGGSVPVTLINTRDCFAYDLNYTEEILDCDRPNVVKKEYYFNPDID